MESKVITQETLVSLVNRLEALVAKLEGNQSGQSLQQTNNVNISSPMPSTLKITSPSVEKITAYSEYWKTCLNLLSELKKRAEETKKHEIESLTEVVLEAICFQQDLLVASDICKKPEIKDMQALAIRYSGFIKKVEEIAKERRDFALHLDAVKTGLDCLSWMFNDKSCDSICQTYFEAIDFPGNKLFLQKIPEISAWVRAFKVVFKNVNELVKLNYKSGINWSITGEDDMNRVFLSIGTYQINFKKQEESKLENKVVNQEEPKEENKVVKLEEPKEENNVVKQEEPKKQISVLLTSGELRKGLKPVPTTNANIPRAEHEKTEQATKKEEATPSSDSKPSAEPEAVKKVFICKKNKEVPKGRQENIWKQGIKEQYDFRGSFYFQNIENEVREIDPEKLEGRTILTFNNCYKSTFTANKKVNAIKLSNCEDVNIICDSLISIFEVVNCNGIKIQVDGVIKSFTIDGSKDVVILIYSKCKEAQFITCQSQDIRLRLRKDEDYLDYDEILIPEQFIFQINEKKKVDGRVSELYNY